MKDPLAAVLDSGGEELRGLIVRTEERLTAISASHGEVLAAGFQNGGCFGRHSTVPTWIAMIPPAVTSQRTSTIHTAAIAAPSPRAFGKRRTELGRYE